MIQRKCGTCKYFEEGGIAASGWCRHPERQALEHMVLVRRTELACRDGWDHDLWEPRDGQQRASKQRSRSKTPRIDSDATVIAESTPERFQKPLDKAFERSSEPAREAPVASYNEPDRGTPASMAWSGERGRSEGRPISASTKIDDTPTQVDELQGESVSIRPMREERSLASVSMGPAGWTDYPSTAPDERSAAASDLGPNRVGTPTVVPSPPVQQSGNTEPFTFEEEPESAFEEPVDIEPEHINGFASDSQSDIDEAYGAGRVELPVIGNLSPCCRNCRDFIPQEGGRQGWCSNPFAFDTRQLVDGDSLACQSSLGSWWSPSDDWWMDPADIAHHSAPTPLVDNLLRELRNRLLGAEGSTEEQERS